MAEPLVPVWLIIFFHPVQSLREAFRANHFKRN